LNGSERVELVHFPGDFVTYFTYSDIGYILFAVEGGYGRSGLWAVEFSLDSLTVTEEPFLVTRGAVAPSAQGTTLVYAPHTNVFVNELVWVDRKGQDLEVAAEPQKGLYPAVAVSPDGSRAAVSISDRQGSSLWVVELDSGATNRVAFEENAQVGSAGWHPSGKRLAYSASTGGDDLRLMIKSPDGGTEAEFLTEGHMEVDFSPDGRFVVFVRPRPGFLNDLWWKDLESGEESVFVQTDTWDIQPSFSPDGGFVTYRSAGEIFVARFPEAEPRWQISDGGGSSPQWSADGKQLYYFNGDDVMEVSIDAGSPFRSSQPERLFSIQQAPGQFDFMKTFAVDGNGERFLMVRVSGIPPGIVVHQNWLEGLQR